MAKNSDPRFQRKQGADPARQRISRARPNNDLAERKAIHKAAETRSQYTKTVRVEREKTFRE